MQRFTPGIGYAFGPVEQALQETFIPALFQGLGEGTPWRGVTCLHVKKSGMEIPDPTKTAPENWTASFVITVHFVAALRYQEEFRTADHSACLREGGIAVRNSSWYLSAATKCPVMTKDAV